MKRVSFLATLAAAILTGVSTRRDDDAKDSVSDEEFLRLANKSAPDTIVREVSRPNVNIRPHNPFIVVQADVQSAAQVKRERKAAKRLKDENAKLMGRKREGT